MYPAELPYPRRPGPSQHQRRGGEEVRPCTSSRAREIRRRRPKPIRHVAGTERASAGVRTLGTKGVSGLAAAKSGEGGEARGNRRRAAFWRPEAGGAKRGKRGEGQ